MGAMASQITSLTIVYSTVYSGAHQRKHQSSASLAFVWGIRRGPVNFLHKWPVTQKMFPFDDVIMRRSHYRSHLEIMYPWISSTNTRSSNKLHLLDLKKEDNDRPPKWPQKQHIPFWHVFFNMLNRLKQLCTIQNPLIWHTILAVCVIIYRKACNPSLLISCRKMHFVTPPIRSRFSHGLWICNHRWCHLRTNGIKHTVKAK